MQINDREHHRWLKVMINQHYWNASSSSTTEKNSMS